MILHAKARCCAPPSKHCIVTYSCHLNTPQLNKINLVHFESSGIHLTIWSFRIPVPFLIDLEDISPWCLNNVALLDYLSHIW
uniref:Uncharacterized protein n=1 Tax=Triticum urartu TaxID=4572 RepID=A0A8R7VBB9_TRIUA